MMFLLNIEHVGLQVTTTRESALVHGL